MDILSVITETINSTLNLFLAYWLFSVFFQNKLSTLKTITTFIVIDIIHLLILLFAKGSPIHYISIYILTFSLSFLFKAKLLHRLTYTALFYVITAAVEVIVAITITKILGMNFDGAKQGVLLIIGMLLSKFISFLIIMIIKVKKQIKLFEIIKSNPISILIFPVSTFAIIILQHAIFVYYLIQNNIVTISVLICYSFLIMANVLVFDFINTLYNNTVNESKIIIADELIANQSEHYKTILSHHNVISRIRHDHKNFCIGVLHELKSGNIDKAIEFISKEQKLSEHNIDIPTDVINAILMFKSDKSREIGVTIDYQVHGLYNISISSVDLAIVLGNALDNAIEATKKIQDSTNKVIKVLVLLKNNTILITIKNPVTENVDIEGLSSTKKDKKEHGFGIISMKQIADRYRGDVILSCENNIFITSILLQNINDKK